MKYFIDTEFIEGFTKPLVGKSRHYIDLISIGIVDEHGRKFYRICKDYNYNDADAWVKENVILPMYIQTVSGDARNRYDVTNFHKYYGCSKQKIVDDLLEFFGCWRDSLFYRAPDNIEVYGYYADYDWVLFCSLFGRMIDLPKGFPMYCKDLKQMLDEKVSTFSNSDFFTKFHIKKEMSLSEKLTEIKKHTQYPQQETEHNALDDAKWNYHLYKFLTA